MCLETKVYLFYLLLLPIDYYILLKDRDVYVRDWNGN
jgi:hypothetical protein